MKQLFRRAMGASLLVATGLAVQLTADRAVARTPSSSADVDSPKRLAVYIEGRSAAALTDQIAGVGPEGLEFIAGADFAKALRSAGLPALVGPMLQNKGARKTLLKGLQKAMMKVGADAVVIGREVPTGRKREFHVLYVLRGDAVPELDDKLDLGNGDAAQRKALEKALKELLSSLMPPPPPASSTKSEPTEEPPAATSATERRKHVAGYEFVMGRVNFLVGGRWFNYSDAISKDNTRPYAVFGPPGVGVGLDVYPAATTRIVVLRDLGLTVDYSHHFALKSATPKAPGVAAAEFAGTWNRLDVGLRYRLRLGAEEKPFVLGVYGGYGFENFTFDPQNDAATTIRYEVPTVRYRHLRVGLDGWLPFGMFALVPRGSFQKVLGTTLDASQVPGPGLDGFAPLPVDDTVYTRFRDASVLAISAGIDGVVVLPAGFEVRAGLDYSRYFSSFKPEIGDAFVAGGALDEFLLVKAGAAYRY
ncbi:MAG: hypothetical protein FJ095_03745 [Deltaproteobacteria bacterium]|nr:hypothetical protein [Deltaproteobacteria bacterium]